MFHNNNIKKKNFIQLNSTRTKCRCWTYDFLLKYNAKAKCIQSKICGAKSSTSSDIFLPVTVVSLLPWPQLWLLEYSLTIPSLSPSSHNLLQVCIHNITLSLSHFRSFLLFFLVVLTCTSKYAEGTTSKSAKLRDDWRQKSRPIPPGGTYPAKDHCRFFIHFSSSFW